MALAAIGVEGPQRGEIVGVAHLINEAAISGSAEFDIMVRTDMQGQGVGFALMKEILARGRERGLKEIVGYVAGDNGAMRRMASELGFAHDHLDAGIVRIAARL
jgi:acetyltransferase